MEIDRRNICKGPNFELQTRCSANKVNGIRKEAQCFKIGMTSHVIYRSQSDDYYAGPYDAMKVVYETTSDKRVKEMEDYLINRFKQYHNCDNVGRGGIGKLKYGAPYSVYVVYKKK